MIEARSSESRKGFEENFPIRKQILIHYFFVLTTICQLVTQNLVLL
jgi:hypothetical protein